MNAALTAGWASLAAGLALQPPLIATLRSRNILDLPNYRSSHSRPVPRGGGAALMVALGLGLVVAGADAQALSVYFLAVVLALVGLIDDVRGLNPRIRLISLLLVGALAGATLEAPVPMLIAIPLMALWTAGYVNAFNFMDGINGISSMTGIIAGATYSFVGCRYGSLELVALGAALVGACASFLPFNLFHAQVFLGDVGSYGIGCVIAGAAWLAAATGAPLVLVASPTILYFADTGSTLFKRARSKKRLMEPHRQHVYQRLTDQGRTHQWVAGIATAYSLAIIWLAALGSLRNQQLLAAIGLFVCIFLYLAHPTRAKNGNTQ